MQLPNELLSNIISTLSEEDLKVIRLTSKHMAGLVTPLLFNQITLAANDRDLENARMIHQNFASLIRTIVVSPVNFYLHAELIKRKEYKRMVKSYFSRRRMDCPTQDIIEESYKTYLRLVEEASEIIREGEIYLLLHHILATAHNVRQIVFGVTGLRGRVFTSDQIPLPKGTEDAIFGWGLEEDLVYRGKVPFQKLLLTISATKCKIQELIVTSDVWLPASTLSLTSRQQRHADYILPFLNRLDLNFCPDEGDAPLVNAKTCRFLAGAINLEALSIALGDFPNRDKKDTIGHRKFEIILSGCSYPKLKTFSLSSLRVGANELWRFLKRLKTLKHLAIEGCHLLRAAESFSLTTSEGLLHSNRSVSTKLLMITLP